LTKTTTILTLLAALTSLGSDAYAATPGSFAMLASPDQSADAVLNGSTGVDSWTVVHTGATGSGTGSIGGTPVWSIWCYGGGGGGSVTQTHTFAGGPLAPGQTVSLDYAHNTNIDTDTVVGVQLLSVGGSGVTIAFTGGSSFFKYTDATNTGVATGQDYNPNVLMAFCFTLTSEVTYRATLNGHSWTGTVDAPVSGIQVFNNNAGNNSDQYSSNLRIVSRQSGLQNPLRASLDTSGQLRFNELAAATGYRVEWALAPGGPWSSFVAPQAALNSIPAGGSGSISVAVPVNQPKMFYRVAANLGPTIDAFSTLQAENFSSMSGIQLEPGNTAIGWFDSGDWVKFGNVDFGDGVASVTLAVAKANSGGAVELRLDSPSGPLLGVITPVATGGWSTYTEQQVNVADVIGVRDLYFVAVGAAGVCNLDWFRFSTDRIHTADYVLFWQDEFDSPVLNTGNWLPVQHGNVDNGELEFYTNRAQNISVAGGCLCLTAIQENYTGTGPWMNGQSKTSAYTSGKVQGQGKISFQYGKIEARMKLPRGQGTWPAFWLLGDNIPDVGWPKCGEIDIMEHANVVDNIGAAIHTEAYNHTIGTGKTGGFGINDYDTSFHTYGMEWTADKLSFYVDHSVYFTVTKAQLGTSQAQWPFDQPFWLILNLAVGGSWGGDPTAGTYPYTMQVDWVRVYKDQAH